jgi:hypothetical protein
MIMASQAYQDDGAIMLWWDESEPDGVGNQNDFDHTIADFVISPDAPPNVNGLPCANTINYTHSSDRLTMQEIFQVGPRLGDAANATDLSDLFAPGTIPTPEPSASIGVISGLCIIGMRGLLRRRSPRRPLESGKGAFRRSLSCRGAITA